MNVHGVRFSALALTAVLALGNASLGADAHTTGPSSAGFEKDVVPFLMKHCYSCHGHGHTRGDLSLDRDMDVEAIQKDREVWETVVEMVRTGAMPPPSKGRKRPAPSEAEEA